ncbi:MULTISPECIES: hypothetical protein [Pseudoalteromonas]|uniref:hypothetical protein n=1 Tax=Pseudoalteromonas TaxID=53246 RepID=UPI0015843D73|nr:MULTISPECIES: hypothetical protein [Pseudoalteromonas]MDI4652559.1 hypothetical protein [Pseudoalteromonas shioyasakiensis]NUJ38733.1 hypothetical protein [Pseudoalteromonas sp. 0303]
MTKFETFLEGQVKKAVENYNANTEAQKACSAHDAHKAAEYGQQAKRERTLFHFFRETQSQFKACLGINDPASFLAYCLSEVQSSLADKQTEPALTEAREMLLVELKPYLVAAYSSKATL